MKIGHQYERVLRCKRCGQIKLGDFNIFPDNCPADEGKGIMDIIKKELEKSKAKPKEVRK